MWAEAKTSPWGSDGAGHVPGVPLTLRREDERRLAPVAQVRGDVRTVLRRGAVVQAGERDEQGDLVGQVDRCGVRRRVVLLPLGLRREHRLAAGARVAVAVDRHDHPELVGRLQAQVESAETARGEPADGAVPPVGVRGVRGVDPGDDGVRDIGGHLGAAGRRVEALRVARARSGAVHVHPDHDHRLHELVGEQHVHGVRHVAGREPVAARTGAPVHEVDDGVSGRAGPVVARWCVDPGERRPGHAVAGRGRDVHRLDRSRVVAAHARHGMPVLQAVHRADAPAREGDARGRDVRHVPHVHVGREAEREQDREAPADPQGPAQAVSTAAADGPDDGEHREETDECHRPPRADPVVPAAQLAQDVLGQPGAGLVVGAQHGNSVASISRRIRRLLGRLLP